MSSLWPWAYGTSVNDWTGLRARPSSHTFVLYSEPMDLQLGQVGSRYTAATPLPNDVVARFAGGSKDMALYGLKIDVVRRLPNGDEESVPLSEVYIHHILFQMGTNASADDISFYSVIGADGRTPHPSFEPPFRWVLKQPREWVADVHLIRMPVTAYQPSRLHMCPCTPENLQVGRVSDPLVNASLAAGEGYPGGVACCKDGMSLLNTSEACAHGSCASIDTSRTERVYAKIAVEYGDALSSERPVLDQRDCGVLTPYLSDSELGHYNTNFNVPKCAAGTPTAECIYTHEFVGPLCGATPRNLGVAGGPAGDDVTRMRPPTQMVDIAAATPHLHTYAISSTLIDAISNRTLCTISKAAGTLQYGTGTEPGNERGYITGIAGCVWSGADAPQFAWNHPFRTIAVYNASHDVYGAMNNWLIDAAAVYVSGSA